MTPEEKTLKIADLALELGRVRRERDAAVAACDAIEAIVDSVRTTVAAPGAIIHIRDTLDRRTRANPDRGGRDGGETEREGL